MPDLTLHALPVTRLDFDPVREGASGTEGVAGHVPSRPGRAAVRFRALFEPRGEPSILVRVGRRHYAVALRDVVAAIDHADTPTPLPAAFTTAPADRAR